MLATALALILCLQSGATPTESALPGGETGPQRWIVLFETRGFDLAGYRRAILEREPAPVVDRIVADLDRAARVDQAEFAKLVTGLGGKVLDQWWLINGCLIEIAPAQLARVRQHPRVARLERDIEIGLPDAPAPIKTSTNTNNHRADGLQLRGITGKGVSVAIIDTGLDSDMANTKRPHATFYPNGDINNKTGGGISGSRMLANVRVGNAIGPDDVLGHGTAIAGIAAGARWNSGNAADDGHAPGAGIVGYAIAEKSNGGSTSATLIAAWQQAARDRAKYNIVVANNSYSGSPDPTQSTQQALDSLVLNADVLAVVSGGNSYNTQTSQSAANGLAVAAVTSNEKKVWGSSSRGPLLGDPKRFYPDISANGIEIVMPKLDDEASELTMSGTSMAAGQVSGAATLLRAANPKLTAAEAKAVLLATTEDISKQNTGLDRNAYGMGYLRDDIAYDLVKGQRNGLVTTREVTTTTPKDSVNYPVQNGKAYTVVLTWQRTQLKSWNWSDLALSVRFGNQKLAGADVPRNLYEKLTFVAPADGNVSIEVSAVKLDASKVRYALAAVEVPSPFVAGTLTSFGTGCPGSGQKSGVTTVVPQRLATQFGSTGTSVGLGYARGHRAQVVFAPSAAPAKFTAGGLAFRIDNDVFLAPPSNYWIELEINLGYSKTTPATIQATFAANIASISNVLKRKRIHLPAVTCANKDPKQWAVQIPFDRPWMYQAQSGKGLLVETIKHNHSSSYNYEYYYVDLAYDAALSYGSRVYSDSATSTSGLVGKGFATVFGFLGSGGAGAVPELSGTKPDIGKTCQLELEHAAAKAPAVVLLGLSDRTWGLFNLPLDLTALGANGCNLLTSMDAMLVLATDAAGAGSVQLPIPFDKSLISGKFFAQAFVFDKPANRLGLAFSNGVAAMIGGQR